MCASTKVLGMQDTNASLSESVEPAPLQIPPDITLQGLLVARTPGAIAQECLPGQPASLLEFMQASPMARLDGEVVFKRDRSPTRKLKL